jgi:phage repressor protein C with HTH and peptisase S24 domain
MGKVLTAVKGNGNKKSCNADFYQSCKVQPVFRGDRLRALMDAKGITQSELSRVVGVSPTSIWKLLNEPSQGSKHTHKIARALNTTAEFLMDESDDQGSADLTASAPPISNLELIESEDEDDELVEVMELDLRFGMGGGSYLELPVKKKPRRFTRGWLRLFTMSPPSRIFIAKGIGDSMAPTVQNADIVIIDTAEDRLDMADQIFAVAYGDSGMIKRLRPMAGGGVKIMSDNPLVESEMAYDGELHVIGKVVAVVRRMAG